MQVILLERVAKLGQMGDVVTVKDGYARNFLLPQKKALWASEANIKSFEADKAQLEAQNLETKKEAEALASKLNGQQFIVIRQASDGGNLYGSVTTRDAADAATEAAGAEPDQYDPLHEQRAPGRGRRRRRRLRARLLVHGAEAQSSTVGAGTTLRPRLFTMLRTTG